MRLTGTLPENRQIKSVVQSIDIVPTVLKLLSIQKSYGFEGKNLTNLIFSKKESTESSIAYSEIRDKVASVRTDNWRYIYNPEAFQPSMIFSHRPKDYRRNRYFIDEEEMYFLPHDPHEQSNVIQQNQKVASELKTALSTWRKKSTTVYHPKEINEETREELRGLGYIQ
jgi:arylsulfatase A-like enzyme